MTVFQTLVLAVCFSLIYLLLPVAMLEGKLARVSQLVILMMVTLIYSAHAITRVVAGTILKQRGFSTQSLAIAAVVFLLIVL